MLRTRHSVTSELLDGADLHDGVSSDQDLRGLDKRVVVVAGDGEEAGQLLHGLREGTLCDQRSRLRGPRLIVRACLLWVSPAPPVTAPPRAASSWPNS